LLAAGNINFEYLVFKGNAGQVLPDMTTTGNLSTFRHDVSSVQKKIIWIACASTLTVGALAAYRRMTRDSPDVGAVSTDRPEDHDATPGLDELMSRVESSFRDVYLQLMTIIQGFAFGALATTTVSNGFRFNAAQWFELLTCLTAILIIWHEYMIGATAFAWIPTILDTVVPFGLGLAEFSMIASVTGSTEEFLLAVTAAWLIGAIAQGNFWFHARRGFAINETSYWMFRSYVRFGFFANVAGFATVAALFALALMFHGSMTNTIFAGFTLAMTVPVLLRSVWQWNVPIRRQRANRRQPASQLVRPQTARRWER
jgi:hypothetical protein